MKNYIIKFEEGQNISVAKKDLMDYLKEKRLFRMENGITFYCTKFNIIWCNVYKRNFNKLIKSLEEKNEEYEVINIDLLNEEKPIKTEEVVKTIKSYDYNNFSYGSSSKNNIYKYISEKILDIIKELFGTEIMYRYQINDYALSVDKVKIYLIDSIPNNVYKTEEEAKMAGINYLKNKEKEILNRLEDDKQRLKELRKEFKKYNKGEKK